MVYGGSVPSDGARRTPLSASLNFTDESRKAECLRRTLKRGQSHEDMEEQRVLVRIDVGYFGEAQNILFGVRFFLISPI